MHSIDSKQATIFVVVFSVIALLINYGQGFLGSRSAPQVPAVISQNTQKSVQPAAQSATQVAVAERTRYIARYLNGNFSRQAGNRSVAIVAANENGRLNFAVTDALTRRFNGSSVQISASLFTPEFVSDGLFTNAIAGSRDLFRKLDLASSVDVLVLAQEDVQYSKTAALENLTTATMRLTVTVVPVSGQSEAMTWTFTAYGPGFAKEVARKAAEERLIKQIADDNKMSLN